MKIGGYKDNANSADIDLSSEVQDTSAAAQGTETTELQAEQAEVISPEIQDTSQDIEDTNDVFIEQTTTETEQAEAGSDEDSSQVGDTSTEQTEQTEQSDASQSIDSTSIESVEVSEKQILKSLSEKLGREVTSFDDLTKTDNPLEDDPYLKELSDWRKKTGRPIEDWIKFQKDYTKVSDADVAREFLQLEYPELSPEEIDLELSTKFISSEDDLDNEAALKNLELKKYASKGRKELDKLVSELGNPNQVSYPTEVQQDLAIAKEYKALKAKIDVDNDSYNKTIVTKASEIKSIKMDLADDISLEFKVPEGSSKSLVNDIQNAPHWKNEDGSWNHDAIVRDAAIIANVDAMLKLAFEQGKNSGTDEVIRDAKNTTLGNRQSNDSALPTQSKGAKIEGLDKYLGKKGMSIIRGR